MKISIRFKILLIFKEVIYLYILCKKSKENTMFNAYSYL